MERTGSQKLLKGLSIFNIATATPMALISGAMIVGGNALAKGMNAVSLEEVAGMPMPAEQAGGFVVIVGIAMLLACVFEIISSIFGMRAADNSDEIKPAWILAAFGLVGTVATGIASATHGGMTIGLIVCIAVAALYFWSANNVMIARVK